MKTINELMDHIVSSYGDLPAVRWLEKKEIQEISYRKLGDEVKAVRNGLLAEGFSKAHIALIGTSSLQWIASYLAITTGDNVAVPLDAGLPASDLTDMINRSDSEAVFLSPKNMDLAEQIKNDCPKVRKIWLLQEEGSEIPGLSELSKKGEGVSQTESSKPGDLAMIIFTSGTTGKSKGVMLTQENLSDNVKSVSYHEDPGCVLMSVLPIHHAFCLVMDWLKGFSQGAVVCINDSFMHMVRNMSIFKPDIMLMVPLMIETIYKRLSAADPNIPPKVLSENVFGGNLRIIFTGGAHLDPFYIGEFEKYGVRILEGYGMSECSPVISSNVPEEYKVGSIGKPLPNVKVRFENGEILVQGSSVMKGYYHMPDETSETLKDGWLHTGDKGYMDEDGFLFINGRVKNLIILSNGENVSPEEIENKIALNPLVGEVIVTGENNGLTARIYPDQDVIQAKGIDEEAVKTMLQKAIDDFNGSQPTYRHITGMIIRKNPFIRNATGKIKRTEAEKDI